MKILRLLILFLFLLLVLWISYCFITLPDLSGLGNKTRAPSISVLDDNKKINDIITVLVISSDNKGLIVKPENCELDFLIKKSNIAVNSSDARPSRFVGGERIDAAIAELNKDKKNKQ